MMICTPQDKFLATPLYVTTKAMRKNTFFDNSLSSWVQKLTKLNEVSLAKIIESFVLAKITEFKLAKN